MIKKKIITNLKIQIKHLEDLRDVIDNQIGELESTIAEINDESKLGVISEYDFGEQVQSEGLYKIDKYIKQKLKELKKTQKQSQDLQNIGKSQTAAVIDDSILSE